MHGPVIKTGTKKTGRQVSIPVKVISPNEVARNELGKIVDAAKRKAAKDYPINTSLIIVFNDDWFFRRAIDAANLDTLIKKYILKLDLRFSTLYLVGWQNVLREFSLGKRT